MRRDCYGKSALLPVDLARAAAMPGSGRQPSKRLRQSTYARAERREICTIGLHVSVFEGLKLASEAQRPRRRCDSVRPGRLFATPAFHHWHHWGILVCQAAEREVVGQFGGLILRLLHRI